MKCASCGKEIVLARRCPYCGHVVTEKELKAAEAHRKEAKKTETSGRYQGPMRRMSRSQSRTGLTFFQMIPAIWRYFKAPSVPGWRKLAILTGVFYIFWPFDLFPELFIPVFGWLDDVAVASITWRYLSGELDRFLHKQR